MSKTNIFQIEKYDHTPENLKIVRQICRDFQYFNSYLEFFEDAYYTVFFGKINSNYVGIGVCSRHGFVLSGDFLWVDQNHRNQGLGSKMIQYMIQIAKNTGLRALIADTLESDTGAIRLYQKFAGDPIGSYDNLYGDGKQIMFRLKIPENM